MTLATCPICPSKKQDKEQMEIFLKRKRMVTNSRNQAAAFETQRNDIDHFSEERREEVLDQIDQMDNHCKVLYGEMVESMEMSLFAEQGRFMLGAYHGNIMDFKGQLELAFGLAQVVKSAHELRGGHGRDDPMDTEEGGKLWDPIMLGFITLEREEIYAKGKREEAEMEFESLWERVVKIMREP
jgi:hypothetical protein